MPRPRNAVPSVKINTALPAEVAGKLAIHLASEVEGKVPFSAYQKFFVARITEFFDWGTLDLAPYLAVPAGTIIRAPKPTIELLKLNLEAAFRGNLVQP